MSDLPNSIKVDSNVKDDFFKNYDAYNMSTLNQVDDYICVFENIGQEIPELILGINYRLATSKKDRKDICENKFRGNSSEPGMYIRKSDWISDKQEMQCAVFNSKDDTRHIYKINGEPRKFPSKILCDKYKEKDEYDIYSRLVRKDPKKTVLDLRSTENEDLISQSKVRILFITLIIVLIFFLYWTISYQLSRPYIFNDYLTNTFIIKSLFFIFLFGLFLYLWCPFDTCYHSVDTPMYRKNFPLFVKRDICDFLNDNTSQLEYSVCYNYDNSQYYKYFTIFYNYLFKINNFLSYPFKSIYSNVCVPCTLSFNCIDRSPKYTLQIYEPYIITENENNLRKVINKTNTSFAMSVDDYLNAVNIKYKNNNKGKEFDTGVLLILNTNNKNDPSYKLLFMASVIMLPNGYEYKWIILKKRSGNMTYEGNIENLKIKICSYSNRILSVDNNYELLGYNYPLDISNFINFFENNFFSYRRFNFFPNFYLSDLKSNAIFSNKPSFMKRKLIFIYKYLISHPVKKFIAPNVSIIDGLYIKYQISDAIESNFIDKSDKLIEEFKDITDYFNDDEDDNDYINYYPYYKDLKKKNFIQREEYRTNIINQKLISYENNRTNNSIANKISNNTLEEIMVRHHDLVVFKNEKNGTLYKCSVCKQTCFI